MIPAALELLMRRLQVRDRKALHGAAMICAEVWNAAGMHVDRDKIPGGLVPKDFLPELPEERAQRLAEEEEERNYVPSAEELAEFKKALMSAPKKR